MKEQYYVGVIQRYRAESGEGYYNALMWYPDRKPGQRYVNSKEKAERVLEYAYNLWNSKKVYNANGKRYNNHKVGTLGVSVECTKKTDEQMEIVKHIIKKRMVTEWETLED